MSWALVLAGVSAAAGSYNAYDEHHANRKIIKTLGDIKSYLKDLKKSIKTIQQQNKLILEKLNELPFIIEVLVEEKIDSALLEEKYANIYSTYEDFVKLKKGKPYKLISNQWVAFSQSMFYVFEYEYRLKNILDLIIVSEIALLITNNRAKPKVLSRLDDKIYDLTLACSEQEDSIGNSLNKLKSLLDNKRYIKKHNLSASLKDINKLTFAAMPNRKIKKRYQEEKCEWRRADHGSTRDGGPETIRVCKTITKTKMVPDTKFHKLRDNHVKKIKKQVESIKEDIVRFSHLIMLLNIFKKYRQSISRYSLDKVLSETQPLYFMDEDISTIDKVVAAKVDEKDLKKYMAGSV